MILHYVQKIEQAFESEREQQLASAARHLVATRVDAVHFANYKSCDRGVSKILSWLIVQKLDSLVENRGLESPH